MKKLYVLLLLSIGIFLFSCGNGEIPSATGQLVELQAKYVTSRPQLDGLANDPVWEDTMPFIVHFDADETNGKEFNLTLRAIWWNDWAMSGSSGWGEKAYFAILATWPDDDKSIDKYVWKYNPADSTWTRSREQSDWLLFRWPSISAYNDVWYWDAALTNPLGYAEDAYVETVTLPDSTVKQRLWIDGLNFYNDTATERNTYDLNYDDNFTPRDSSDDKPKYAWKEDITTTPPSLPRIFSADEDRYHFLLRNEADFLKYTPYAEPTEAVTVPGYVLEDPVDHSADILAAGTWSNGQWTVEIVRAASTDESNDIVLNPNDRWFNQVIYVWVGNNEKSPIETGIEDTKFITKSIVLNFEYVAFERP